MDPEVALALLVELIPPPEQPVGFAPWTVVEEQVGLALPDDYKKLLDIYGAGTFFDGLRLPGHDMFAAQVADYAETARDLRGNGIESMAREAVFPEPGSLVPWAHADGYYFLWKSVGPPNGWPTYGGESLGEDPWPGSATESVLAYATGGTDRFRSLPPEVEPQDRWHDGRPIRNWFEPEWRSTALLQAMFATGGRPFVDWLTAAEDLFREVVPRIFREYTDQQYSQGSFESDGFRVAVYRRDEQIEFVVQVESRDRDRLDQVLASYKQQVGEAPISSTRIG
jgi:hypothetical protein